MPHESLSPAFSIIAKPAGPFCNLDCRYCFYLPKRSLFPGKQAGRMSVETLELFVRQYIASQPGPEVHFIWQGGEPALLGPAFFRNAFELQVKHCPSGKRVSNSLQTNGTLLDDEWGALLKEHDVLVGLSLDGPQNLHEANRGKKTFAAAMRGLECLHKYAVRLSALTCISRANQECGREVYRFLRDACGLQLLQFIPVVIPAADEPANLASPANPLSVQTLAYGKFLCDIFDEWLPRDFGRIFVQQFEVTLAMLVGLPPPLCIYAEECGRAAVLEHDGRLYSCDHFVSPEHTLGSLHDRPLAELLNSARQKTFGQAKRALPRACRLCEFLELCHGECPKNRLLPSPAGQPNLNYLCAGLKTYFAHTLPIFTKITRDLTQKIKF
jgi:uncharacterized protein